MQLREYGIALARLISSLLESNLIVFSSSTWILGCRKPKFRFTISPGISGARCFKPDVTSWRTLAGIRAYASIAWNIVQGVCAYFWPAPFTLCMGGCGRRLAIRRLRRWLVAFSFPCHHPCFQPLQLSAPLIRVSSAPRFSSTILHLPVHYVSAATRRTAYFASLLFILGRCATLLSKDSTTTTTRKPQASSSLTTGRAPYRVSTVVIPACRWPL